jgi:hypothetical protein
VLEGRIQGEAESGETRKETFSLLHRTGGYLQKGGTPVPPDLRNNVRSGARLELRKREEMEKIQELSSWRSVKALELKRIGEFRSWAARERVARSDNKREEYFGKESAKAKLGWFERYWLNYRKLEWEGPVGNNVGPVRQLLELPHSSRLNVSAWRQPRGRMEHFWIQVGWHAGGAQRGWDTVANAGRLEGYLWKMDLRLSWLGRWPSDAQSYWLRG